MTRGKFIYCGEILHYLDHPYNRTGQNMRTVEVPIIQWYLRQYPGKVLEIGNVLSHYCSASWDILDAREIGHKVINADVMSWLPREQYDLIVSISTIEHIGFGRYANLTRSPVQPSSVIERLRGWLKPNGLLVATVPTQFNKTLDDSLIDGSLQDCEFHAMRRISDFNVWEECTLDVALAMPYQDGRNRCGAGMVVILCRL